MTEHEKKDIKTILLKHLWVVPLVVVPILFLLDWAGVKIPTSVYIILGVLFVAIYIRSLFQKRPEVTGQNGHKPEDKSR